MSKSRRTHRKEKESQEFYENPEVLADKINKTEEFFAKNKVLSLTVAGVIAVAFTSFFLYQYYTINQNRLAQADMFQAVFYFEQDSLDLALNGDGNNYGFGDIVSEYPRTDAANLSNYYAGIIHLKKGNHKVAVLYLEDFSSSDLLIQARAYSLIGDAYMEQGDYENAVSFYDKAANYNANEYFSPIYLKKAALAYEKLEQWDKAKGCFETIVEEYKTSTEFQSAQKDLARLDAKMPS
ncbi:MAG: tetratricopeptide repeat protein [Saprospiraceae bacterium]|nr:tetratricopeptide repeat protein [Saprospiraceae bacterium]